MGRTECSRKMKLCVQRLGGGDRAYSVSGEQKGVLKGQSREAGRNFVSN